MQRVFGLDLLRSLAITLVLLGHGLTIFVGQAVKGPLEGFYGFLGVELFFVLSGFLVGSIALGTLSPVASRKRVWTFLTRRWFRTLPNYYLFLLANVGLNAWLGGPPFDARYLVFAQNFAWTMPPFFGESWSLTVEELFYLTLPVVFIVHGRTNLAKSILPALLIALAAFTLVRIGYVIAAHPEFHAIVRKTATLRLDSLMYGVLAAWTLRETPELFRKHQIALCFMGTLILVASVRTVVVMAPVNVTAAALALSGVSIGVALTLPYLSSYQVHSFWIRGPVEGLSRISYALYLCHLPTVRLLEALHCPKGWLGMTIWLGSSILVATLVHVAFERPIMSLRDRLPRVQRSPASEVPLTGSA